MEIACSRCHQAVVAGTCYCPGCGMPQLVYSTEGTGEQGSAERSEPPVRDAASVDWKQAIRIAAMLAIPAGILSSMLSPVSIFGIFLMGGTGAWVVAIYLRRERPALVTGIVGGWTAAAASGIGVFAGRFFFHQGKSFDDLWHAMVDQQLNQRASAGFDLHALDVLRSWMLSPEGRAGWVVGTVAVLVAVLMLFAVAGGALGARMLGRPSGQQL